MNLKYFFIYSLQIEQRGLDIGFKLYGLGHLIWLVAILLFIIFFSNHYKKQSEVNQRKTKKFFAVTIVLLELTKDMILIISGAPMIGYLPFHLCSFAIFGMIADAFSNNPKINNLTGQFMMYAFFPGAVSALMFCNWTEYPFANFMCIHSFVFHGWIVCYAMMNYFAGKIKTTYSGLWKTAALLFVCSIPIYIFNSISGQNYLFLNEASEGSPLVFLWNIFGTRFGQAGYVLAYAVLVITVFHFLYAVDAILDKIFKRGRKE